MNKLNLVKRIEILHMLCEGSSLRSISRVANVSFNTVLKMVVTAGEACADYHDKNVKGLKSRRVEADEIWSFSYAKDKTVKQKNIKVPKAGSVWTWTALDSDSKLIISYRVGGRDSDDAILLMDDLRGRLENRVQLTTDGHKAYLEAVEGAFGDNVDYAQLVKLYGPSADYVKGRYSPAECIGARKTPVSGNPDKTHISTSIAERMNYSIRVGLRRFTRLSSGFSKKLENHYHALALYFMFYNYVRIHKTLKVTPAMASGLTDKLWEMSDLANMIDEYHAKA